MCRSWRFAGLRGFGASLNCGSVSAEVLDTVARCRIPMSLLRSVAVVVVEALQRLDRL